jgi:Tfp pilus assembly protein PilF
MSEMEDEIGRLLARSESLYAIQRYGAAAELASEAARRDPSDPRPYWAWARALSGDSQFAEAARMADVSIRLAPQVALGFRLRANALSSLARGLPKGERGQLGAEATASAREAVRLAPYDPNPYLALASALTITGEIPEADRAIRDALRLAPNSAATWVTASLVAISAKNWEAAISASRHALAIEPENYAALNNLGISLRASGKNREGTRVLAEAARTDPDAHLARQNLSRAGLKIVRVAILVLLLPLGFLIHAGFLLYLVFAVGSNIAISKYPSLALRLERVGAPIAMFVAGKPRREPVPEPVDRTKASVPAAKRDRPWSAMDGHRMHGLGNPVLIFCAVSAWAVALTLVIGLVVPGSDKAALAIAFVGFAGLGALPAWTVHRRRVQGKAWARDLAASQARSLPDEPPTSLYEPQ